MFKKFKRFIHLEIQEHYKAGFEEELKKANYIRCLVVLLAIGLVMLIWLIPAIKYEKTVFADSLFLLTVVVCIILLILFKDRKYIEYFHLFIMVLCLFWAQYSNFNTNGGTDNFTPYLVGVLAFASFPYVKPLKSLIILCVNQIIFLIINSQIIDNKAIFIDLFGNSTLFLLFALAISVFHYNSFVNEFKNGGLVNELNQVNRKLEDYMRIDVGTGISNRFAFEETLKTEWERSKRTANGISLAMIDIDFFKQYNDTYGHSKGDICLKNVAQCIKNKMLRVSDFAGRFGGEEFVIIMPETDYNSAITNAERIRLAVEELKIKHESRPDKHSVVTISLGVATISPGKNEESNTIVEVADKALYQAKKNGRNRVEAAFNREGV